LDAGINPRKRERIATVGKHKITTTINPGVEITVDDAEYLDLQRQKLIKSEAGSSTADEPKTDDKKKGE
jgi:hypothetical protein